jgi:hypothetical protein
MQGCCWLRVMHMEDSSSSSFVVLCLWSNLGSARGSVSRAEPPLFGESLPWEVVALAWLLTELVAMLDPSAHQRVQAWLTLVRCALRGQVSQLFSGLLDSWEVAARSGRCELEHNATLMVLLQEDSELLRCFCGFDSGFVLGRGVEGESGSSSSPCDLRWLFPHRISMALHACSHRSSQYISAPRAGSLPCRAKSALSVPPLSRPAGKTIAKAADLELQAASSKQSRSIKSTSTANGARADHDGLPRAGGEQRARL